MFHHFVRWLTLAAILGALVSVVMTCPPKPWKPPRIDPNIKPGTEKNPKCINNQWSPPPKGAICGGKGRLANNTGAVRFKPIIDHSNFFGGPNECYQRCFKERVGFGDCKIFAVWPDKSCDMFQKIPNTRDNQTTASTWYEPRCFCNLKKKD